MMSQFEQQSAAVIGDCYAQFGEPLRFTPEEGPPIDIVAIVDAAPIEDADRAAGVARNEVRKITARTIDDAQFGGITLPRDEILAGTVTYRDDLFAVRRIVSYCEQTGQVTIEITRSVQSDVGRPRLHEGGKRW